MKHLPIAAIPILVLLAAVPLAVAETYDLYIFPYCAPGPNPCGFADEQTMRTRILDTVHEVNVIWEVTGISFRPTIWPIDSSNPAYYMNTGCSSVSKERCSVTTSKDCFIDADCPGTETCLCSGPDCVCEDRTSPCTHDLDCGVACGDLNWQRRVLWRQEVAETYDLAISMMITDGQYSCCSNVANDTKPYDELFGIFCDVESNPATSGGWVWAHELGHHFCLSHTFNGFDFLDTMPTEPDYDHDVNLGVNDTPPDPLTTEGEDISPECVISGDMCAKDEDCVGSDTCDREIYNPYRDFCTVSAVFGVTDDASPHGTKCAGGCQRCDSNTPCAGGSGLQALNVGTQWSHLMSYYGAGCVGPYVVNGFRTEGISPGSQARINWCEANVTNRSQLPDVCEFDPDVDNDGWCYSEDNCPTVRNTNQSDVDGDLDGDECDLCKDDPTPTGDLDNDAIGDVCDDDMDGDGCKNWLDRRPMDRQRRVGGITYTGCPVSEEVFYSFEGDDRPDNDGIRNCWDVDDDNDGICDDGQSFPWEPHNGAPMGGCVAGPDPCPGQTGGPCEFINPGPPCPPAWLICIGTQCEEFDIHIFDVINPGIRTVITEFEIWDRTIYMLPPAGMTPSELAVAIAGGPAEGTTLYNMVIVDQGGAVKAVIADGYTSADVVFPGDIRYGRYIHLTPSDVGGPMEVATGYAIGTTDPLPDREGDNRPDLIDNCVDQSSFLMTDADLDGFGNLCDADLDNDGMVTTADVQAVEACDGADLDVPDPISEPVYEPGFDIDGSPPATPPDPVLVEMAETCAAADLNDDRRVDDADRTIALGLLGSFPGPSGFANLAPVADAGPDLPQACGGQVTLDAGASVDPEGAPLTCGWSSADCAIADPASCTTTADCPDGVKSASLVVNDGLFDSSPDNVQVVTACIPGRVPPTMTMTKNTLGTIFASLQLEWESSCQAGNYAIYEGTIGNWYDHTQKDCSDDGGDLTEVVFPDPGDTYYIVVPLSATSEGSYGRPGPSFERPVGGAGGLGRCRLTQNLTSCP